MADVLLSAAAEAEYEEALAWYFARSPAAANGFEQAFAHGLQMIADNPLLWTPLDDRHRGYILQRYPYVIVYRIESNQILVVAVAHTKRRPGYWKRRA